MMMLIHLSTLYLVVYYAISNDFILHADMVVGKHNDDTRGGDGPPGIAVRIDKRFSYQVDSIRSIFQSCSHYYHTIRGFLVL